MAATGTIQIPLSDLRGSFVRINTEPARDEKTKVHIDTLENQATITHQLSRLEQIVEYLKVLYR
ncbi:MAG TPA: hypothetical protein VGQ93_04155 [Lysobacter sp.]|jgi:hypothetical protein|nr:hypothetical protein [Lysobacter sp.]